MTAGEISLKSRSTYLYYVADCIKELYDQRGWASAAVTVCSKNNALLHFRTYFDLVPLKDRQRKIESGFKI